MGALSDFRAEVARMVEQDKRERAAARKVRASLRGNATTAVGEALQATNPATGNPIWESCPLTSLEVFREAAERIAGDATEVASLDFRHADWQSLYESFKD
jgi:hypothetical protein